MSNSKTGIMRHDFVEEQVNCNRILRGVTKTVMGLGACEAATN